MQIHPTVYYSKAYSNYEASLLLLRQLSTVNFFHVGDLKLEKFKSFYLFKY